MSNQPEDKAKISNKQIKLQFNAGHTKQLVKWLQDNYGNDQRIVMSFDEDLFAGYMVFNNYPDYDYRTFRNKLALVYPLQETVTL